MLSTEQKEEVVETMRIYLERMLSTMERHFRREYTADYHDYFSEFERSWRACLKKECDSFQWLRDSEKAAKDALEPCND